MSPSDANSPLAALRQLKEMLDAGTITPQEFEVLKRQLIFGAEPTAPAVPSLAENTLPPAVPEASSPAETTASPSVEMTEAVGAEGLAKSASLSANTPDWLAAAAPNLLTASEPTAAAPLAEERRNPLNLIFMIGGGLLLLAIVLYLTIERQPASEHLTSTSQTAADTTAIVPEVGPQAEQITLPPAAAPETVRVAPPPPSPRPAAASQFAGDSAVRAAPASTPAKANAAPVPAEQSTPPAIPDSTTRQ